MIDIEVQTDLASFERVRDAIVLGFPKGEFLEQAAELTLRQQVQHLAGGEEADPTSGRPWPRWSAAYRAAGAPFDGNHRLLLRSQDLLNSLKIGRVTRSKANVGTDSVYAKTHQEGRGPIPARPYMGIGSDDLDQLEILAANFIVRTIERAA